MSEIRNLGMTDTEYAALAGKGYDPQLEQLMIQVGKSPEQARKLTRLVGFWTLDKEEKQFASTTRE
jgi:hypothetical protein